MEVVGGRTDSEPGAGTQDYLQALTGVRPTVTEPMRRVFDEDIESIARVQTDGLPLRCCLGATWSGGTAPARN